MDLAATSAPGASDDLSALAWVHGELRRSLETATKALRRYLKEAEAVKGSDIDAVDPSVLRTARTQLHQGVGALELVGLPAVADVLRASESAVQRMVARPQIVTPAAVETVERVSFALLDYLGRQLAGKPMSPVALFPQYRAAMQLAAADRIHPADLWKVDWVWHELPPDASATPRSADDDTRSAMETLVLALMRPSSADAMRRSQQGMSDLCADLGAGARLQPASPPHLATFWQMAAAVFEAQARGLLPADLYAKRLASRLLAQLRMRVRGEDTVSDRLAQDLLFFCSHAREPDAAMPSPRLAAVRQAWRLGTLPTADYEVPRLGRFDPAVLALARKRVGAARDTWSAVAGGELHRLGNLPEQFSLVGDSLLRLLPDGNVLAESLQQAAAQTVAAVAAPPAPLAMEVATAILYLDASLDDGEFDHPELAGRIARLADRIDDVRGGAPQQPLDPWMEELYRRVSDRQTMGSVVQELRASLSEIEKQIDQYFRDPRQRQLLIPVPAQLSAMRSVLSVLGLEQASAAAVHMRDEVDRLAQTEVEPQAQQSGVFDRLADNLGALSFLIDMLSVQPALAKSLFRYDPATGMLAAVMGQSGRAAHHAGADGAAAAPAQPLPVPAEVPLVDELRGLAERSDEGGASDSELAGEMDRLAQRAFAADQPELANLLAGGQRALAQGADDATRDRVRADLERAIADLAPPALPPAPPPAPIPQPRPESEGDGGLDDDEEMREIFIEEAREVVADAHAALQRLAEAPENTTDLTAVRRAFHTLKGSSRMVGLASFGEGAWACEQLYNARLAQAPRMDPELARFTESALRYLGGWTEAIADRENRGHAAADLARVADAMRLEGRLLPLALPGGEVAALAPSAAPVADLYVPPPDVVAAEPTAALPPPAEAPLAAEPLPPAVPDLLHFDFASDAAEGAEAVSDDGTALPATSLAERVPDLPSAADLDLGLPEPQTALPVLKEAAFELDLSAFGDPQPLPLPADAPAPDLAQALADLPLDAVPEPVRTAPEQPLELDLSRFDDLPAAPAQTAASTLDLAPEPLPAVEGSFLLDLAPAEPVPAPVPEPEPQVPQPAVVEAPAASDEEAEQTRQIGPLTVSIPLFNIYLNEADELSRRLGTELAEWALEHDQRPVPDSSVALAHALAGSSATVGYGDLSALARALEHALMRSHAGGLGRDGEPVLFTDAADEIRRLLHQFAAGFLKPVDPALMQRLADHERLPMRDPDDAASSLDKVDPELLPIFEEEADELLPQLQARLRDWHDRPADGDAPMACMRALHTVKGGARLAGAMRLGEMAHQLEAAIEALVARGDAQPADVEPLMARADAMSVALEALRRSVAPVPAAAPAEVPAVLLAPVVAPPAPPTPAAPAVPAEPPEAQPAAGELAESPAPAEPAPAPAPVVPARSIDWQRFDLGAVAPVATPETPAASGAVVRVRAGLLDRLVNQAGEVSITRARIDGDVKQMQAALSELTESLERMRRQLRDIELQAETQISSRLEAAKASAAGFDPLEMDRFTRFQELTRFMAESVNDVATTQRSLQRTLQSTEDELAAQARLTRELQDDLLRTRMVEFESMSDRLHRTARQAARDTGKQARLEIVGGSIEVDRGVLERMAGSFEHLLRNSVAHGIEGPEARAAAGKDPGGLITVTVAQVGNEVAVEFGDDGGGLDYGRIRNRAIERGLLSPEEPASDDDLGQMIFRPGFSTAESVTELAGRGVGLDVVRSEVYALGGRIETHSDAGRGTRFKLLLPLTTAVTQVVMLRCGDLQVAVPSTLIEVVRRLPAEEVQQAYDEGRVEYAGEHVPFFWLPALLRAGHRGTWADDDRSVAVVIVRSTSQRVAVHVDEVVGNQEVVVKNVGPQLSRLPGLAGVTLLPSGGVALIYNPVALASLYGDEARVRMGQAPLAPVAQPLAVEAAAPRVPLVMVVDDSLTVRRVTQRLLAREGYRVVTAKDGLEALERLAEERPAVLLSDIEMPRMDGFDLLRNVRADARLAGLPVVMITSRIAQKHRDYAAELGVDHYLGKPYAEDELLGLVARYAGADVPA